MNIDYYLNSCKYNYLLLNKQYIQININTEFIKSYLYKAVLVTHFNNIPLRKIKTTQKEVIKYFISLYHNTYIEKQYYNLCNINNNDTIEEIINKLDTYINGTYDNIDEIDDYTTKNLKINHYIVKQQEDKYDTLDEYFNDINNSKLMYYLKFNKYNKALDLLNKNIKLDYKFKKFRNSFLYYAVHIHKKYLDDEPPSKKISIEQKQIIKYFINYYKDNEIIQSYITKNKINRNNLLNSLVDFIYKKEYIQHKSNFHFKFLED